MWTTINTIDTMHMNMVFQMHHLTENLTTNWAVVICLFNNVIGVIVSLDMTSQSWIRQKSFRTFGAAQWFRIIAWIVDQ